ncbi:DNA topoisomerase (ATP-hydrolyzing) subunit B [archaeon SCG-AAA382B04]|nr:DNA topoisomerase (ATP-hydrolyzing) subunit B [archaeon SCG-AAA382B04]
MGLEYDSKDIEVLEGLSAVRKRPGMYIGNTSKRGLHHLVYEVVDNSIDEAMADYCDKIKVTINKDKSVTVEDNGRGIPIDTHPEEDKTGVEIVMTKLHAGGKFDNKSYQVSGGLHGVGVSVVNALSEQLEVTIKRNNGIYKQKYKKGIPQHELKKTGTTKQTGTQITFKPDTEIFETLEYDYTTLKKRLRELAFLNKGLTITLKDKRTDQKTQFHYEGGIKSFVKKINETKQTLHPKPIYFHEKKDGKELEVAIQYTDEYNQNIYTFANNINTKEGGTHLSGFKSALTRTINQIAKQQKVIDQDEKLKGTDVREGITAIISIKLQEPQFEGQTKTKLGNSDVRGIVRSIVNKKLKQFLLENPNKAEKIFKKAEQAMRAREAAKEAKELTRRKTALETTTLPGKLADCTTKDKDKSELFVVEGDSAGGCFTGETEIKLASGSTATFKELVEESEKEKTHYCFTIMKDGSIGIEEIKNPRLTKKDTELVEVEIDNGEVIECTPNHEFMLRSGEYKEAQNLELGDSLMPLYTKKSDSSEEDVTIDGYEMIKQPNRENYWEFVHLLADRFNLQRGLDSKENGSHRHHLDFDKTNNRPNNIKRMTKEEHREEQSERIKKCYENNPEAVKARYKEAKELWEDEDLREWRSEKTKEQWTEEFRESRKESYNETYYENTIPFIKEYYEQNGSLEGYDEYRAENGNPNILTISTTIEKFFDNKEDLIETQEKHNHKVISISKKDKKADVYDIEVPRTHNFALASGIFVHNSAKQARDREFQAILPLRGKILNAEKARLDRLLENKEIKSLIKAIGTGIGEEFDISKRRYNKIIINTDADVDGAHITTLLLTFFYRYMNPLIEEEVIYIAKPPLYQVKKGSKSKFVYTEEQKQELLDEWDGGSVQRYKGLGEMSPKQLWQTTMNPENRVLMKVKNLDDVASDELFNILMGKKVAPRKNFIMQNASEVSELDI